MGLEVETEGQTIACSLQAQEVRARGDDVILAAPGTSFSMGVGPRGQVSQGQPRDTSVSLLAQLPSTENPPAAPHPDVPAHGLGRTTKGRHTRERTV